jgi:glutathione peroxidase
MAIVTGYAMNNLGTTSNAVADESKSLPKVLSFKMNTLEGQPADFSKYSGKVIVFVNVASKCGMTGQYKELQKLHDAYGEKGLVIVGVPCNQFGGQEPAAAKEIREFCTKNYNVTFDMLEKVNVNDSGSDKACELFKYLTEQGAKPVGAGPVKWNFEKFVLDRKGSLIGRFGSGVKPDSRDMLALIEKALAEKS